MFGIGSEEFIIIAIFAFMIFGPERLPQMGKVAAKYFRQFKSVQSEVQRVVKNDIVDPITNDLPLKDNALEELFTGDILKKQDSIQKSYGVYSANEQVDACAEKPALPPHIAPVDEMHNENETSLPQQLEEHLAAHDIPVNTGLHSYLAAQPSLSDEEKYQRLQARAAELFGLEMTHHEELSSSVNNNEGHSQPHDIQTHEALEQSTNEKEAHS